MTISTSGDPLSLSSSLGPLGNVSQLVAALVRADSGSYNTVQNNISTEQSQVSALGRVSSALNQLQTAANALSNGQFLQQYSTSSSSPSVATATTSQLVTPGNYALNVTALAQAQSLVSQPQTSATSAVSGLSGTFYIAVGSGTPQAVNLGSSDVSLTQAEDAINALGIGVTASVVQSGNNQYKFVLASNSTGTDNGFTLSSDSAGTSSLTEIPGLSASTTTGESQAAANAAMSVNGIQVTSDSNTVSNVVNGVTFNVASIGLTNVNVSTNTSAIDQNVRSYVTAYNNVQSLITNLSAPGSNGQNQGILANSPALFTLQQNLYSVQTTPASSASLGNSPSYQYLAQIGLSLQSDGTLGFNQTTFNAALATAPTNVAAMFSNTNLDGVANKLNSNINNWLSPTGLITSESTSLNAEIQDNQNYATTLQKQLQNESDSLTAEYSALNASLAQMQSEMSSLLMLSSSSTSSLSGL